MLDLKQLRYFVTIAELENISRAADVLNVTQSPLSRQMQDLEARLGFALFDRVKKRVRLTAPGRSFLAEAKAVLDAAARCEQAAAVLAAGQVGPLRVGYVEAAVHSGLIAGLLQHLHENAPQLRVELRSLRSAAQIELLRGGSLDFALTHSEPAGGDPGITSCRLVDEPFVIALETGRFPPEHVLSTKDLGELPFIAPPLHTRAEWRRDFVDACNASGFQPDIRVEAAELATVLELVRGRAGAGIVQASAARTGFAGVSYYSLPPKFPLRLRVYAALRRTPCKLAEHAKGWIQAHAASASHPKTGRSEGQ